MNNEHRRAIKHNSRLAVAIKQGKVKCCQACIMHVGESLHRLSIDFINYKYKEKLVILQSIGIIVMKSKETRVVTYTCRYSLVSI